ncbi:MAG: amidohydrolase family protein [Spirochaetes bacterium]|nr:amidohydrolase family protein [Spirochaetota bacterium]
MESYSIRNGIFVTPASIRGNGVIGVSGGQLTDKAPAGPSIDLGGDAFVYPALVNSHDHLRGDYLPRVGPPDGIFYLNWSFWDNDLKASGTFEERSVLNVEQMYRLGAYKNLFSGVATVNDHFPHEINEPHIPHLPIRVITNYTLAHECSTFDLKWGDGIEIEHGRAKKRGWPFITHLEEGFDPESMDGIGILEKLSVLDSHALLIHCIGFSDEDVRRTAAAGASVSWCPASNMFMFNVTCKIRKLLKAGVNVAIGTDSTHTGSANLFEEMKYARQVYRDMYGEDLGARALFDMTTINPARAFRMADRIGTLEPGKSADILVLRARNDDAFENLAQAGSDDVLLLTVAGEPVFGSAGYFEALGAGNPPEGYESVVVGGRRTFVKGAPLELYRKVRELVGFGKRLEYLPFEVA